MSTETEIPPVTDELLAALEFRYADPRACRVCGAPLEVGDSRGMKMSCTSDAASPLRYRYEAAGVTWKDALDHWSESTMYNPPDGDVRVLALVAEHPAHGWALASQLAPGGELGSIRALSRPVVYHALERLEREGKVEAAGIERVKT